MVKCLTELPEAYPAPIRVHNTFIDATLERSPSLERFYREREVSTCPSAHIGRLKSLFQESAAGDAEDGDQTPLPRGFPEAPFPETLTEPAAPGVAAGAAPVLVLSLAEALHQRPCAPSGRADAGLGAMSADDSPWGAAVDAIDAPARPAQGLTTLPSVGSAAHLTGRCKPCAFFYTKGCESNFSCEFCHLCEPGEKKRRKKDKLEARRAAHKERRPSKQAPDASLPQSASFAVSGFRQPIVRS